MCRAAGGREGEVKRVRATASRTYPHWTRVGTWGAGQSNRFGNVWPEVSADPASLGPWEPHPCSWSSENPLAGGRGDPSRPVKLGSRGAGGDCLAGPRSLPPSSKAVATKTRENYTVKMKQERRKTDQSEENAFP